MEHIGGDMFDEIPRGQAMLMKVYKFELIIIYSSIFTTYKYITIYGENGPTYFRILT